MAGRLLGILHLGEKILPKSKLLHQSLYLSRGMAKKKDESQGTEKGKKTCGKNQFFGGCFKKSEPYRKENKKEKSKRCRDPCKDGPCRPEK
ncbi:uncharacterized protein LOC119553571 [Drosophila subpulchrella]|uniref:uncharacterized protein LOC119553571 n=1 Tax=Drosophila subpulchrella TaxID=1486046 RepID=UPI0018A12A9C|nr:uncharacterized protein LOC119553571 [Drosophila subpulchrella]